METASITNNKYSSSIPCISPLSLSSVPGFNSENHELPQLFQLVSNTYKRPPSCLCPRNKLCKDKNLDLSEKWRKGHYNLNESKEDPYSKILKPISRGRSNDHTVKEMADRHLQLVINALKRTGKTPTTFRQFIRIIHFHPLLLYDEANDSFPSYIHDASVAEHIYGDDANLYKIDGRECWFVVPTLSAEEGHERHLYKIKCKRKTPPAEIIPANDNEKEFEDKTLEMLAEMQTFGMSQDPYNPFRV